MSEHVYSIIGHVYVIFMIVSFAVFVLSRIFLR
jgi:hypothetical protein